MVKMLSNYEVLPEGHQYDFDPNSYDESWINPKGDDSFKVVIRIRPPLPRELRGSSLRPYHCVTHVEESKRIITLSENIAAAINGATPESLLYSTYRFTFDHVYDQSSAQEDVYNQSAKNVVLSILQGYNAAIIAYGQTGTGKTYTMEGDLEGPLRGITPRTVEDVFTAIVADPEPTSKYLVRISYLQIYNEVISDLLKPERTNLSIREDKKRGIYVEGLSEWVVRSPNEVYGLLARGQEQRATGTTKMNEVSSRSHAVAVVIVEKCTTGTVEEDTGLAANGWSRPNSANDLRDATNHFSIKVGKLNLVDLAGSERVHITGATGKRLEESKKINASLSALGNVIAALTERRERSHIPYRDSKLTRYLEDSIGGNCKTTMIATIAPSHEAFQESLSTLKFANRAKSIKNDVHVNEDGDQRTLLRKYERELRRLRAELARRNRELVDKRHLLEMEEQKRRAEADKMAALTELEHRSRQFLKEKEEKRVLEARIGAMQGQLIFGGGNLDAIPALKEIVARENQRVREKYEARLKELEAERQAAEEDRAQVDRYKQLLLKQRDIMIALTGRLNERDEEIARLREELEAYERYRSDLEDVLDSKTAELIGLRKAALTHASASPGLGGAPLRSALGDWGGAERGSERPESGVAAQSSPAAAAEPLDWWGDGVNSSSGGSSSGTVVHSRRVNGKGVLEDGDALAGALASRLRLAPQERQWRGEEPGVNGENAVSTSFQDDDVLRLVEENRRLGLALEEERARNRQASKAGKESEALQQRMGDLEAACTNAQRERAALKMILENKVCSLVADMMSEVSNSQMEAGQDAPPINGRLMMRLKTLEQVLDKVTEAIRSAPPII